MGIGTSMGTGIWVRVLMGVYGYIWGWIYMGIEYEYLWVYMGIYRGGYIWV